MQFLNWWQSLFKMNSSNKISNKSLKSHHHTCNGARPMKSSKLCPLCAVLLPLRFFYNNGEGYTIHSLLIFMSNSDCWHLFFRMEVSVPMSSQLNWPLICLSSPLKATYLWINICPRTLFWSVAIASSKEIW